MTRLLLVEDDEATAEEIRAALDARGFAVRRSGDGLEALRFATTESWDLLVVDRMLPSLDGLSLILALREADVATPILVLTALGAVDDRIAGLRAGGDDYLVKPFAVGELSARLEVLLRRQATGRQSVLRVGSLELDLIARHARRGQRKLELLPREFQLLEFMMRHENQVVTRAMLLERVWNYRFPIKTNLVDVHMGRLRRKLDLPDEDALISNVRGTGFILRAPA